MTSQLIGTDEAGYGPNLGPLVISATLWRLPDTLGQCDLWAALDSVVSQTATRDGRLHVADSKQVYSPGKGLARLERSVLALLGLTGNLPRTLSELRRSLTDWRSPAPDEFAAAWYADEDLTLPVEAELEDVAEQTSRLRAAMTQSGISLQAIRSDVVTEPRFNRLTDAAGSKGAVLTEATLALTASLWGGESETLILCDKHGGRNRYAAVLSNLVDGSLVLTRDESRDRSVYQVGRAEFRFETRAERHLPVAVASMVAKYVREVSMDAFNAYWQRHQPGLKGTKGYPQDAARFRTEIAATKAVLGVPDSLLWRRR